MGSYVTLKGLAGCAQTASESKQGKCTSPAVSQHSCRRPKSVFAMDERRGTQIKKQRDFDLRASAFICGRFFCLSSKQALVHSVLLPFSGPLFRPAVTPGALENGHRDVCQLAALTAKSRR
jgi:hypothetical protein